MQIRGNFSDFYGSTMLPAVRAVFFDRYKRLPKMYSRVFKMETSTRSIEQYSEHSGVGLLIDTGEGESIRTDSMVQGFDRTFEHGKFGLGIEVSREAIVDDKFGIIKRRTRALANSTHETREIQAFSVLNRAFNTSFVGPDGKVLCATDHPLYKSGGVQSNRLSVAADLDHISLQLALTGFETMKSPEGFFQRNRCATLAVAPANRWNAFEILKSDKRSDTTNNATNALQYAQDGMPTPMVIPYLDDEDGWFLLAEPEDTGLVWIDREQPYEDTDIDKRAETAITMIRYRNSVGFYNYNGVFGSPGA
jgi:hypothetical protein